MSLKYRITKRALSVGKQAGKTVQVAGVITRGKKSFGAFCREVADGSTLTTADVKAVIDRMVFIIRRNMEEGMSVEIDDLGIFSPALGSLPVPEGEEFYAAKHIREPRVVFRLKKSFRQLSGVSLERLTEEEMAARSAVSAKRRAARQAKASAGDSGSSSSPGASPSAPGGGTSGGGSSFDGH